MDLPGSASRGGLLFYAAVCQQSADYPAFLIIPAGMGKELSACPFQLEDYAKFGSELDVIIDSLKNREK